MRDGLVRHVPRDYQDGDLRGALLAYASTRDPGRVRRLVAEAEMERVLLNVIDVPAACAFLSPAVLERGDLRVAIGTGGASPGLSAVLRRDLEDRLGPEYGPFVAILAAVRRELGDDARRAAVLEALVGSPLLGLLRQGDRGPVDALLGRLAGEGCTLERLGVVLEERAA